ncbi:uncharacterized protein V1516DRAFT_126445 [Lipomyces oligophaga]|uniref:uncharacterized protein n=1 Tax=Lipomyces oligophaga TaxID=45792 RepID=UPI0034CE7C0E
MKKDMQRISFVPSKAFRVQIAKMTTASVGPAVLPDEDRIETLCHALGAVRERVDAIGSERQVRLVAVSKLKPASDIYALYEKSGQRHFGENYVQELVEKAAVLPKDIQWHFIGSLQSNKCGLLANIPNLFAVETIDNVKKARRLNEARKAASEGRSGVGKLKVFIQVNTSGEDNKSGASPGEEVLDVAKYITTECEFLELQGLMTIGSIARSHAVAGGESENPDFSTLMKEKHAIESAVPKVGLLELSMGMSEDYEVAIRQGSTNVRVGSTIFGARPPKTSI